MENIKLMKKFATSICFLLSTSFCSDNCFSAMKNSAGIEFLELQNYRFIENHGGSNLIQSKAAELARLKGMEHKKNEVQSSTVKILKCDAQSYANELKLLQYDLYNKLSRYPGLKNYDQGKFSFEDGRKFALTQINLKKLKDVWNVEPDFTSLQRIEMIDYRNPSKNYCLKITKKDAQSYANELEQYRHNLDDKYGYKDNLFSSEDSQKMQVIKHSLNKLQIVWNIKPVKPKFNFLQNALDTAIRNRRNQLKNFDASEDSSDFNDQ